MEALASLSPGSTFAKDYRIIRPLASGGMGAVYLVEQISTSKQRALKLMHPQLVSNARSRERFTLEAQVWGQLRASTSWTPSTPASMPKVGFRGS